MFWRMSARACPRLAIWRHCTWPIVQPPVPLVVSAAPWSSSWSAWGTALASPASTSASTDSTPAGRSSWRMPWTHTRRSRSSMSRTTLWAFLACAVSSGCSSALGRAWSTSRSTAAAKGSGASRAAPKWQPSVRPALVGVTRWTCHGHATAHFCGCSTGPAGGTACPQRQPSAWRQARRPTSTRPCRRTAGTGKCPKRAN
mmetsp:Transcript_47377/g.148873  ORF Transcript_47377/g.148873 Transcript_47377/m.148873 type:complete len:200 (+) Transcript_47377:66-665(+)